MKSSRTVYIRPVHRHAGSKANETELKRYPGDEQRLRGIQRHNGYDVRQNEIICVGVEKIFRSTLEALAHAFRGTYLCAMPIPTTVVMTPPASRSMRGTRRDVRPIVRRVWTQQPGISTRAEVLVYLKEKLIKYRAKTKDTGIWDRPMEQGERMPTKPIVYQCSFAKKRACKFLVKIKYNVSEGQWELFESGDHDHGIRFPPLLHGFKLGAERRKPRPSRPTQAVWNRSVGETPRSHLQMSQTAHP